MARVTINDIAKVAGYSKTSVSFAFNDPGRISDKARDRILAVADQLGYVPDPVARTLSLRRHGSIGLLLPEVIPLAFRNSHLSQIVQGIGEICGTDGHSLTLIPPLRESVLEGVRSAAVDGLITIGLEPGMDAVHLIRRRHLPFVTIDGRIGGGFPVVGIDDERAAETMMNHVLSIGHRKIVIVAFSDEPQLQNRSYVKGKRIDGYRRALADAVPTPLEESLYIETESSLDGGRTAVEAILQSPTIPTAIVAMSDVIALGILEGLEERGYTVPGDFSLVGFDDIPESRLVRPQLTTISQSGYDKGHRAAEVLMRMIRGETVDPKHILPTELTERDSCAPPGSD
jgi:DNA-binding LacI/PurR family transcriptional regulator